MSARDEALEAFRQQQQDALRRVSPFGVHVRSPDVMAQALDRAKTRETSGVERDGMLYADFFSYHVETERQRFAHTREILERSAPGPDEDGVYIEMVARQAASIELVLRVDLVGAPNPTMHDICNRVLVGTLPTVNLDAYSKKHGDFYFVQLSAGLIDFLYQVSKAVVLSWKPTKPAPGMGVAFKCDPDDVNSVLAADPAPYHFFVATMEAYLFSGRPRDSGTTMPPPQYHPPLGMLTNFNERFVLAHEYCHALHDALDVVHPGIAFGEEYASDAMAFKLLVASGEKLDRLPANMSTQGSYFVLTTLGVIQEALDIVRLGAVRADAEFLGHPPIATRLQALRDWYRSQVPQDDPRLALKAALNPANTLRLMWERLLADDVAARWKGRALHPMWQDV